VSRDGFFLFSASGGSIKVWNVERNMDYRKIDEAARVITATAISDDGKYGATGTVNYFLC